MSKNLNKVITLTCILFLFLFSELYSQEFSIAVSYLKGEKSKDSHSSEESIAISDLSVAYSIKYSGRKGAKEEDFNKTCTFTEQNIKNIKQTIIAKELNVNDSLFDESSKSKSIEVYTNISIAIAMDGQEYKIKINGDTEILGGEKLYKNAVFFIALLRKMVIDC